MPLYLPLNIKKKIFLSNNAKNDKLLMISIICGLYTNTLKEIIK